MDADRFAEKLSGLLSVVTLDPGSDTDRSEEYSDRHRFTGTSHRWDADTLKRLRTQRVQWTERLRGEHVEGAPIPDGTLHDIARAFGYPQDCTQDQVESLIAALRQHFIDYPEAVSDQDD